MIRTLVLFVFTTGLVFSGVLPYGDYFLSLGKDKEKSSCINYDGETGQLKRHSISINHPGRLAIGDIDNDGDVDYIISNRNQITAYDACEGQLWSVPASTNWDIQPIGSGASEEAHPYWNWSNYGWVGNASGDSDNEFIHIGADWRTLYIRDGKSGQVEKTIDLGPGKWLYTAAFDNKIVVTQGPGFLRVKAIDINTHQTLWDQNRGYIRSRFVPPFIADINQDGFSDIIQSTMAVNGRDGSVFWVKNFTGFTTFGLGSHTITATDLDPSTPGLETSYSAYAPANSSSPSIIIVDKNGNERRNFHGGDHPHQHTVGDFRTDVPGKEVLVRHGDGASHWLVDRNGSTIRNNVRVNPTGLNPIWGLDWGFQGNEIIQGIEWDGQKGTEVLYIERHNAFRNVPLMVIQNHIVTGFNTRVFHGSIDVPRRDITPNLDYRNTNSWYGWIHRSDSVRDGPYEGGAHVVDVFGDGREEIIALSQGRINIYYNSGDEAVPSRWADDSYRLRKKIWGQVYNPR